MKPIEVYGVLGNPEGWPTKVREALTWADLVVGAPGHGASVLDDRARFLTWCSPVEPILDEIASAQRRGDRVVVLASGDPLLFGVGTLLHRRLGRDRVRVHPGPSSVSLACARLGWPVAETKVVSVHGRPLDGLGVRLSEARRAAILTGGEHTPQRVARHLGAFDAAWEAWVAERLGYPDERLVEIGGIRELVEHGESFAEPNLLLLRRPREWTPPVRLGFVSEEEIAARKPHRSLVTKREVRLVALGLLALRPDAVLWDIGAGSGSVAIEAARLTPAGFVYAIERHPESIGHIEANRRSQHVDNVFVVHGEAPEACRELPEPDAVFVGGSGGRLQEILEHAWSRLRPGGRIVLSAVTLETLAAGYAWMGSRDPELELIQLQVARGRPLANLRRWDAANPVVLLGATKTEGEAARCDTDV